MPQSNLANDLSSSTTLFADKRDYGSDSASLKKFVYLAFTFASSSTTFDIFSKVYDNVRLLDFIVCEITMGMTYMCMDFFIKQYTRRIDFNQNLNPLLKGITYGVLLQSALWTMLHASDLADSIRFLATSFTNEPRWSVCQKENNMRNANTTCVPSKEVIRRCRQNIITPFNDTAAHKHYLKSFTSLDQNIIATRFFSSALVWIFTFFCSAVMDDTLIKIFRMSFICRTTSTFAVLILLLTFSKCSAFSCLAQILDVSSPSSYTQAMDHVAYAYGIGFVGIYDFDTMSPYTMVDNAVVIFTIMFTLSALARSLIVKILHVALASCVEIEISITPHYLIFAILPVSTEFLHAHKLYIIYIYLAVMLGALTYLALLTLTMSKLLHSDFRSLKSLYIVGILCFLGFSLSVPITVGSTLWNSRIKGLIYGMKVTVLYLGGCKVAIVMWIYGVHRFSTDIHFWLGFKPAKFWITCWMFLPVALFSFFLNRVYVLFQMRETDFTMLVTASIWITFSVAVVEVIHIRTLVKFLLRNNFAKAFSSSSKYGPPDSDDRKRRKEYNETIQLRQCTHNCNVLDDTYDCNHLPLLHRNKSRHSTLSGSSTSIHPSVTDIYESDHHKRHSLVVDSVE